MLREGRLRRHKLHIPRADFSLKSQPSSIPLRLLSHQCPHRGHWWASFCPSLNHVFPPFLRDQKWGRRRHVPLAGTAKIEQGRQYGIILNFAYPKRERASGRNQRIYAEGQCSIGPLRVRENQDKKPSYSFGRFFMVRLMRFRFSSTSSTATFTTSPTWTTSEGCRINLLHT